MFIPWQSAWKMSQKGTCLGLFTSVLVWFVVLFLVLTIVTCYGCHTPNLTHYWLCVYLTTVFCNPDKAITPSFLNYLNQTVSPPPHTHTHTLCGIMMATAFGWIWIQVWFCFQRATWNHMCMCQYCCYYKLFLLWYLIVIVFHVAPRSLVSRDLWNL